MSTTRANGHSGVRLLVVVGTDHHRFDRLIEWVDSWLTQRHDVTWAVVQHGTSRPPRQAEGHPLLGHDRLEDLMGTANMIVTHGGPATILEARRVGVLPIAVARDPQLGEHVDDHQQRFVRMLASRDLVISIDSQEELEAALDLGAREPQALRLAAAAGVGDNALSGITRVGEIVDELVDGTRHRRPMPTPNTRPQVPVNRFTGRPHRVQYAGEATTSNRT